MKSNQGSSWNDIAVPTVALQVSPIHRFLIEWLFDAIGSATTLVQRAAYEILSNFENWEVELRWE